MTTLRHFGLLALALLWIAPATAQVSYQDDEGDLMDEAGTPNTALPPHCDDDDEMCRILILGYGVPKVDSGLICADTPFGPSCRVSIPRGTAGFYLAEAVWHSAIGNYEAAVVSLDSAVVMDQRSTYARALLGYALAQTGDVQGAMRVFRDALAISDGDTEVFYQRALVKEQLGDSWGALADLRSAIEIDHDDFRFHLRRGLLLASSEDYSQALAAADRAVATSNDDCADCFFLAGALRFSTDRPAEPEVGCRYLSRAGELGNERSYDLIRQFCR